MAFVKSIANSAPVSPTEVEDIVSQAQKDDANKCLIRIMKVYTQSHLYLAQWKSLRVDIDCLKRNIGMVRRFEASGLQLEGKGLWLLSMILEYGCDDITIDESTHTVLFDTLLRVAVETSASSVCTAMLLLLVQKFNTSCSHLFQTGCAIADQLPASIAADNFIALLDFSLVCIELDPPCALLAGKFLVSLAANVTPNHKANYFLHNVVTRLGGVLLHAPNEGSAFFSASWLTDKARSAAAVKVPSEDNAPPSAYSSGEGCAVGAATAGAAAAAGATEAGAGAPSREGEAEVTNTTQDRRELEAFVYVLLAYLVPLHPTHAQILMKHPLRLPHHTVERLCRAQLSEAGECAALLFLDSLCIDTGAKDELKSIISIDLMRSKMSVLSPTVTEKATKLFLSLFAEDIECNYRPRSSVDLRESSYTYTLRSHSASGGESGSPDRDRELRSSPVGGGGGGESARSDCSWSISGVTCLRDLLNIALSITESALKATSSSSSAAAAAVVSSEERSQDPSASFPSGAAAGADGLPRARAGTGAGARGAAAAFHYLNSIVYHVGLCVEIHRICSLHDIVARIVALILAQFEDMAAFDLSNAKIVDTMFLLMGMRERCWQPCRADLVDTDYLNLSSSLVEHFMALADPVITDSSDDRTLPASPISALDTSNGNLLNAKVVSFATDRFLRDASFLQNFLEEWEVESIEAICQKLLLVYCRLQLGGIETLTSVLDLELFQEMLWDVLSDDRHGIDAYPEMRRKCIQLFTTIGTHMQPTAAASAAAGAGGDASSSNSPVQTKAAGGAGSGNIISSSSSVRDSLHATVEPPPPPPKELAYAAALAELALKILTTQEHSGASDEDDDDVALLPYACTGVNTGASAAKQQSVAAAKCGPTDGGKCVSRIFRTRKHVLQLRYSCLSCVTHICETTRTVRRKVIANYAEIVRNFSHLDPVRSMSPLLQLVTLAAEYLTKVESAGEESIVTLLVRCLRFPDADVRTQACESIAVIGAASPGLMHRGICRPEVEDLLIDILRSACIEEEPQQHSGPLVRAVLKACNALCHDINIKPGWVPSPYTYHWSRYSSAVSTRPLFVPAFLDTLQLVVRRASRTYILQYCALVLSIVTCLMYSCNDGVFSAKAGDSHVIELKAALLQKFLPWIPVILDYLTSHRKIIRSMIAGPSSSPSAPASFKFSDSPTISTSSKQLLDTSSGKGLAALQPSSARSNEDSSDKASSTTATAGSETSTSTSASPAGKDATPASSSKEKESQKSKKANGGGIGTGLNIMNRIKRKSTATPISTGVGSVVVLDSTATASYSERRMDVRYSPSAENLAEKVIEAMHSFLCMDEMFPLSTYLQNATMFNGTPVIACVSYFMTECRANVKVQRRGIDFLRHFADNQIGLSSIAMHSPCAILHAARLLSDTLEVQYSFCRIVSSVARSDEFARENFVRFNVQNWLVELIHRQHPEQSRLACVAASDLCVTPGDTISVCQGTGVIEAVVALLDALPSEFKVQVEGTRVLVTVEEQVSELLAPARKLSAAQVLKKTKKFLTAALRQETFPEGYERGDVETLLNSTLWAKDPLMSKIMGFFG